MSTLSFEKTAIRIVLSAAIPFFLLIGTSAQTTLSFSSSNSFTAAAGVSSISVECWGGGGGGGNAAHSGTGTSRGGGGAGAAYARKNISSPSGAYTITVGAAGTGGIVGGDSWFGSSSLVIAKGGAAGGNANKSNGSGGTGTSSGSVGDAGAVFAGGSGQTGSILGTGGGAGGAGSTGSGNNASLTIINGGATSNNGGAGGAGFLLPLGISDGNDASNYGGGGGGASCITLFGGGSATGGKGGAGLVTVTYTCPTYSLTGTANTSTCAGTTATVTLTSSAATLPTGTYTVTYNLGSPNTATGNTATMTVSTAGTGTFTTSMLASPGATSVTITNLKSGSGVGCSYGISSNNAATITVYVEPTILTQPSAPATICSGSGTQTISVAATGSMLGYSWRRNGITVSNGGVYSGQGTSTLTLTNATAAEAGNYDVVVSGICSPAKTSNSVVVAVNAASSVTADAAPLTQIKLLNSTASNIAIAAAGTSISYQWYSNTSNSNYGGTTVGAANGGQTNTYTPSTSVENIFYYYCVVSGTCGTVASSAAEVISTNTDTWMGISSPDWNNGANWNTGSIPSGTNHVIVPTASTPYPVLPASAAANNIALNANTSLNINSNTLTVNGVISGTGNFIGSYTSGLVVNGNAGTIYFDNSGTNNYLKDFTIANGASATLGNELNITPCASLHNEGILTVTGTGILNTNGFLVIKSNEFGTARIAQGSTSGGYISGEATVERYIPQNANKAWRMLAANTSGQTIKEAWQENQPAMANGNPGHGIMITKRFPTLADAEAAGFDTLSNSPSIYSFDAAIGNWAALANTNTKLFASEEGYFVFIRGDRSAGQFTPYTAQVAATVLRSKGTIFQGNQATKNVAAGKYALMRNPFASAIDARNISISGGTVNAFQVWDPKLAGTAGNGAYQALTKVGSDYVVTPGGGSYPSSGSVWNSIESGAGFIVQATGTSGTVQVLESSKTSGSNIVFRPASPQAENKKLIANLYADNSSRPLVDGNMILFDDANENAFDKNDVRKLVNMGETFGIAKAGNELVVERMKIPSATDTINFYIRSLKRINYQLEFIAIDMDVAGMYGYVEDRYTNTGVFLNPSGNTLYNFSVNTDSASFAANRFRIVIKPLSVLPLSFIDVRAGWQNSAVHVQWQTAGGTANGKYEIERSVDGNSFASLGVVNDNNNNHYQFTDGNTIGNVCCYRIKFIEANGHFQYSKIVKVGISKLDNKMLASPNPVRNNFVNIQAGNIAAGKIELAILNGLGEKIYSRHLFHIGGLFKYQAHLPANLSNGVCELQLVSQAAGVITRKLIIDKSN